MKELISRTAHYNIMANEIHKVIEECEEKHPTIREEKVKQFEEALTQLCAFWSCYFYHHISLLVR